ncbi:MAG: phage minor head protein, partial [bacterium]
YEAVTGGISTTTKPISGEVPTIVGGEVPTAVGGEVPPKKSAIVRLIEEIQKVSNNSLRKAQLIARDQTAKANAVLTQVRQQRLGIQEYIWQTCQDERVRPTHASKHGKIFRWDSPPPDTGHPGHDY